MPRTGLSQEELRERALEVTLAQLRKVGSEKLRLVDVAKAMDVKHTSLYPHFANKAALVDAVTAKWLLESEEALAKVCALDLPARERVEQWFMTRYTMNRDRALNDAEVFHAYNLASDAKQPAVVHHLAALRQQMADLMHELGYEGDTAMERARLILRAMVFFIHPAMIAGHAEEDHSAHLRETLDCLLNGMKVRDF
ncbi:TetR/AcrR family transcriptional regulator [Marivivens aquimaris]|uniref:TetR/AcrR family transcriptional regulator n=1 Tax=Marivivens aquimaris TaxID=2774876 RepID=UPI00187FC066|nr:TetR family transcriptional regulator [Marivivens aquimaris]